MLGKNGLYFASRQKVARKVTVAVERVFTLYMMQDAVREMTIYMKYPYDFLFSYMPVTCAKHCFKGLLSVLGLFRVSQLHASYMSYAQVTTSNSRERPQIAENDLK